MTLPDPDPPRSPLSDARKERIKLRANYVNGVANAFIVAGALTIPLSIATETLSPALGIPLAVVFFFVSFRLHVLAQDVLDELDL